MSIAMEMRYTIDVNAPLKEIPTQTLMVEGNKAANEVVLTLTENGQPADLSGCTASAYFVRETGDKVQVKGSISGNEIRLVLTEHCYYVPGCYAFMVQLAKGEALRTVLWLTGRLISNGEGGIVDEENILPSIEQLEQYIQAMEQAIADAQAATEAANTVANLTVKANTLPAGQAATASYSNGVLTLGLPKGATGSSSPIKVNGIEGVDDNITLTGADVPMGNMSVAEAVKLAGAKNLLDNSNFLNPVNQRGQTTYTGQVYGIDRWKGVNDAAQMKITSAGLELYHAGTSGYAVIQQFIAPEIDQAYRNQMLTLALCMSDGSIFTGRGIPSEGTIYAGSARLDIAASKDMMRVYIQHSEVGQSKTFRWVAVYPGEYTAETLPEYTPRDYAAELLECQRYYVRCKLYHLAGQMLTESGRFALTLPTEMRVTPTLTLVNAGTMVSNGVADVAVTGATINTTKGNRVSIYTTHATQSGWARQVGVWISGEIGLSADL